MPFYEFKCDGGHVTDLLCKMLEKPREVECRKCGGVARSIMSATLPTMGATPHYASKEREVGNGTSVRCPDITCRACEHTFYEALTSEEAAPPCPKCGSTDVYERVGMPGADWSNRNYPYFDRGLGCIVRSPGHRKQICKERNLIPVDGDWDEDREIAKLEAKDEELRKVYEDYTERLETHPAYRGYRIARDQGRIG